MRQLISVFILLLSSTTLFADDPQVVLTSKDSYNGYATVGGIVTHDPKDKVAITVKCGRLEYTTLPDANGNWAVVFRHTNVNFLIHVWNLDNPQQKYHALEARLNQG